MNILYLGYWGVADQLTNAAILPHLQVLQGMEQVKNIYLATIERNTSQATLPQPWPQGIHHLPLYSQKKAHVLLTKLADFRAFPKQLIQYTRQYNIDLVVANSTLSGALAQKIKHATGVPFWVEYYEPHADYMLESGVWKAWDPRYKNLKKWEKKQLTQASGIITASQLYEQALVQNGLPPQQVRSAPCSVDLQKFAFQPEIRAAYRKKLTLPPSTTVGVYVGKFGGMYLQEEAYQLFATAKAHFKDRFFMLILTPHVPQEVEARLQSAGFTPQQYKVLRAAPHQVPAWLSAADFAFATYKPGKSKMAQGPVKVGEYWAAGLPVIITHGVGEDHKIIEEANAGAQFWPQKPATYTHALEQVQKCLDNPGHQAHIMQLAAQYRGPERIENAYKHFFTQQPAAT